MKSTVKRYWGIRMQNVNNTEMVFIPFDPLPYVDHLDIVQGVIHCIAYGENEYMDYSCDEADDYLPEDELEKLISVKYVVGADIFPKMWRAFLNLKPLLLELRANEKEITAIRFNTGYVGIELEPTRKQTDDECFITSRPK